MSAACRLAAVPATAEALAPGNEAGGQVLEVLESTTRRLSGHQEHMSMAAANHPSRAKRFALSVDGESTSDGWPLKVDCQIS